MNIFTRKKLEVTKSEVKKEHKLLSDEKLQKEVTNRIMTTAKLHSNKRLEFLMLLRSEPLTRKQAIMFLDNFTTSGQVIAYLYRHLLRCAYFYGVPKVVIKNYKNAKDEYYINKNFSWVSKKDLFEKQMILRDAARTLYLSTGEMIQRSETRKSKLNNLIDKIADKEN